MPVFIYSFAFRFKWFWSHEQKVKPVFVAISFNKISNIPNYDNDFCVEKDDTVYMFGLHKIVIFRSVAKVFESF